MVVQHNISAMTANRYYGVNNKGLAGSLEKLASGYAINKAGDNAAGLAVSEKMRAQIGGLTQASKNAEDGISMVQTYEGALQETDSILQRMRTLAVQSANGSYQDDVDRDAIQLEFDQLNDELNQIADTDFNGTVVLNGGQMADGLKAVNGKFNYASATSDPHQLSKSELTSLDSSKFAAAQRGTSGAAGKTNADELWGVFSWDRTNAQTNDDGPESFDVTFKYDGNGGWTAEKTSNATVTTTLMNGLISSASQAQTATGTGTTNNGGFTVFSSTANKTAGSEEGKVADVIVDASKLQAGDTITLTFKNPNIQNYAPGNATLEVISNNTVSKTNNTPISDAAATAEVQVGDISDAANLFKSVGGDGTKELTKEAAAGYNALSGAEISLTYDNEKVTKMSVSLTDGSKVDIDMSADNPAGSLTAKDGTKLTFTGTKDTGVTLIKDANGDTLFKISPDKDGTTLKDKIGSGTVKYALNFEAVQYNDTDKATVTVDEPSSSNVSLSNSNKASKATMTYTDNLTLQVGARTKDSVNFTFSYKSNGLGDLKADMDASARGLGTDKLSLATQKSANEAIDQIDNAINKTNMIRATFGAIQNRLEHKISNLDTNTENMTAAESRIRDTQMDKEMMKFTSSQILSQASQSMLAQANQLPQGVLQLLG